MDLRFLFRLFDFEANLEVLQSRRGLITEDGLLDAVEGALVFECHGIVAQSGVGLGERLVRLVRLRLGTQLGRKRQGLFQKPERRFGLFFLVVELP